MITRIAGHDVHWECDVQLDKLMEHNQLEIYEEIKEYDNTSGEMPVYLGEGTITWHIIDWATIAKDLYNASIPVYEAIEGEYGRDEKLQWLRVKLNDYENAIE